MVTVSSRFRGFLSSLSTFIRSLYSKGFLYVALSLTTGGSAVSSWLPTAIEKGTETDANPTTSDATSWKVNICGGCTSDSNGGVSPEKESFPASKVIQDGKGAVSSETA
ncbi:hypothetical protein PC116_g30634 [Phytophthora cactorum]|nr:hypothetical protein PC116_g30634 [Phytophthora cactorum]